MPENNADWKPSLIIFDVEGVLLPKRRYLLLEASRRLGPYGMMKTLTVGILYEVGILPLEKAIRIVYGQFRGLDIAWLLETFREIPLISGVEEVFDTLAGDGYRVAMISSGLPTQLVQDLANRLGAEYAFGLDLEVVGASLSGRVGGDAIKPNGKEIVLRRLMEENGFSKKACVVVADDRNNLPMLPLCGLSIGFNPDFLVGRKADHKVDGNLQRILPLVGADGSEPTRPHLSKKETFREAIHVGSFLVPISCQFLTLDRLTISALILVATIVYAISELLRLMTVNIPIISTVTRRAAVGREVYDFAATPIFFALGIVLSLVIFPAQTGYASVAILTLGDGVATLFGKLAGRVVIPFSRPKTVEGTAMGLIAAIVGASLFISPFRALTAAAAAMAVELVPLPVNDNLSIPLVSGLVLTVLP